LNDKFIGKCQDELMRNVGSKNAETVSELRNLQSAKLFLHTHV